MRTAVGDSTTRGFPRIRPDGKLKLKAGEGALLYLRHLTHRALLVVRRRGADGRLRPG